MPCLSSTTVSGYDLPLLAPQCHVYVYHILSRHDDDDDDDDGPLVLTAGVPKLHPRIMGVLGLHLSDKSLYYFLGLQVGVGIVDHLHYHSGLSHLLLPF